MSTLGLMIDLETVGMEYNSGIAQIGAIIYDEQTFEIISEFCQNINHKMLLKTGDFTVTRSTLDWWKQQDVEIVKSVFTNTLPPEDVAKSFLDWVKKVTRGRNFTLMSNHILFDINKIDYFLSKMVDEKLTEQTRYNRIEDFATIRNKAKWLDYELLDEIEREYDGKQAHNALDDCRWQLFSLEACLGIMAGNVARN